MGIKKLDLSLHSNTVLAGNELSGCISVLGDGIRIVSLRLLVSGVATVAFECFDGRLCKKIKQVFYFEEDLWKEKKVANQSNVRLFGEESINFSVKIDENAPGSFQGVFGKIEYSATAILKVFNPTIPQRKKVAFEVRENHSSAQKFAAISQTIPIGWKGSRGNVMMAAVCEKNCLLPSEQVKFQFCVDNNCKKPLGDIQVKLIEEVVYNCDNIVYALRKQLDWRSCRTTVAPNSSVTVKPDEWDDGCGCIVVPAAAHRKTAALHSVHNCDLIKCRYFLVFEAQSHHSSSTLSELRLPIFL